MTGQAARATRWSFSWRRGHLLAMLVLTGAAAAALARAGWSQPIAMGRELPFYPKRVAAATEKIDPNTASAASLRRLPGIGQVRALAIVRYRRGRAGGTFRSTGDLMRVPGIGPGTVQRIAPYLALPPTPD